MCQRLLHLGYVAGPSLDHWMQKPQIQALFLLGMAVHPTLRIGGWPLVQPGSGFCITICWSGTTNFHVNNNLQENVMYFHYFQLFRHDGTHMLRRQLLTMAGVMFEASKETNKRLLFSNCFFVQLMQVACNQVVWSWETALPGRFFGQWLVHIIGLPFHRRVPDALSSWVKLDWKDCLEPLGPSQEVGHGTLRDSMRWN